MYSKNILDRVKLNEMKFLGDSIIYQRALLVGSPIVLDHVIGAYRVHRNNTTYNMPNSTVIGTLNEYISTKKLAINEFSYNKNQMDNWLVMRCNTIINWYLSTCNVTPHSAKILSQWVNENHLKLYENVNIKLINKIKNK